MNMYKNELKNNLINEWVLILKNNDMLIKDYSFEDFLIDKIKKFLNKNNEFNFDFMFM